MNFQEGLAEATKLLSLKSKWVEAIEAFVNGQDVFVSLLTRYGKSLIYAMFTTNKRLVWNQIMICVRWLKAARVSLWFVYKWYENC